MTLRQNETSSCWCYLQKKRLNAMIYLLISRMRFSAVVHAVFTIIGCFFCSRKFFLGCHENIIVFYLTHFIWLLRMLLECSLDAWVIFQEENITNCLDAKFECYLLDLLFRPSLPFCWWIHNKIKSSPKKFLYKPYIQTG